MWRKPMTLSDLNLEVNSTAWNFSKSHVSERIALATIYFHTSQKAHVTYKLDCRVDTEELLNHIHCVSKNVPPLACYNFDTREWILIFLAEMLPKQSKDALLYHLK